MGSVVNRGTRHKPRFIGQYKDADGVRRSKLLRGATSKEQAHTMLAEIERNVMHGKVGVKEPTAADTARASLTVRDLAERFLGDVEDVPGYAPPRIKSLPTYRSDARSALKARVLPTLGTRAAASVTMADVERLRDSLLAAERAGATVVHALAILSKVYTWARKAGHIDCANPVQGVERPRTNVTIDFLDKAEVGRLLAKVEELSTASPSMTPESVVRYPMVVAAIYTGMRKGELLGLRWADVHLDAARVDVNRSYRLAPKSGKARHLPLHPELVRVLRVWKKSCPATKDGLVFPTIADGPRSDWHMGEEQDTLGLAGVLTAAGCHAAVDGKPWHLLRHTFASQAVMAGTSLYEVQRLLGHATPAMTQRYAHLAPDHLAGAVARLDFSPAPMPAGVASMDEERRRRG